MANKKDCSQLVITLQLLQPGKPPTHESEHTHGKQIMLGKDKSFVRREATTKKQREREKAEDGRTLVVGTRTAHKPGKWTNDA